MNGQSDDLRVEKKPWYRRSWVIGLLGTFIIAGGFAFREAVLNLAEQNRSESPQGFSGSRTVDPRASSSNDVEERVNGVDRRDAPYLGSLDAPLVIVEFGDFECPFCQEAFTTVHAIASAYGDQIRFIWRDFPVSEIHENAQLAAEAGRCAFELKGNEAFWRYHDRLFINQEDLSVPALKLYASQIGLDVVAFDSCLTSRRYRIPVQSDYLAGVEAGVSGTPTFFFNGRRIAGAIPENYFRMFIEEELARSAPSPSAGPEGNANSGG